MVEKRDTFFAGTCGENMTYRLEDGILYIDGQGEIEPYAFYNQFFDRVVIAEGCTRVGEYAFAECHFVKEVELPNSLQTIADGAFLGCPKLRLQVPDSVTSIGEDAFLDVERVGAKAVCNLEDGVLHIHCQGALIFLPRYEVKEVVIHEGCTQIGGHVFQNWEDLKTVYTPVSLEGIDYYAFEGCKYVQLEMKNARILWERGHSEGLLGVHSFDTVKLPYKAEGDTLYVGENEAGSPYILQKSYAGIYDMNWMEPGTWDQYEHYPWFVKFHKTIRKIVIAPGCKIIGEDIFRWFEHVQSIEIPWGVEEIEAYAFAFCEKLKTLEIPDTVTRIGRNAFEAVPHITYHGPAQSDDNWGALSRNIR